MNSIPPAAFTRRAIERSLKDLPPLPEVAQRVLSEAERPNCSPSSMERLIELDQAIASKVLRVVNSAYYGLPGQVCSLSQACVILGIEQIRNLVLSMCAFGAFQPKTERQHQALKSFWLHSFGTAAATQSIAVFKKFRPQEVDTLFVCGLLHDIGRLFLYANFTQVYDDVVQHSIENSVTLRASELRHLGMSHGDIGSEMAIQWKLPEQISRIIKLHEGPFTPESDPSVFPIHIGDAMTKDLYFEEDPPEFEGYDGIAFEWLGANDFQLKLLQDETENKVKAAESSVGLLAA